MDTGISIWGQRLGVSYGYDKGITLVDLLNKIVERNRQIDYKIFLIIFLQVL